MTDNRKKPSQKLEVMMTNKIIMIEEKKTKSPSLSYKYREIVQRRGLFFWGKEGRHFFFGGGWGT